MAESAIRHFGGCGVGGGGGGAGGGGGGGGWSIVSRMLGHGVALLYVSYAADRQL